MGNLVTTQITVSGSEEDLRELLGLLTETDPEGLLTAPKLGRGAPVWTEFAPWRAVPVPDEVEATRQDPAPDLGLAVLSRDGTDHLRLKRDRNPAWLELPPDPTDTAEGLLRNFGLETLRGEALRSAAEARSPGCLDAGRRAIAAYEATGEFGWLDWRLRHWGVRAFGPELRLQKGADGALALRFDSVNDCPVPLLRRVLARFPGLQMSGAALDEDGGFAVLLATDGTELIVSESLEAEDLAQAYELIYGHPPEPEDEDPEP